MLSIRARQFRVVMTSILAAFVPTRTEMGLGRGQSFPRWAALPLLVLLASGLLWAGGGGVPAATFDGVVTTLSTGSVTMAGPEDVTVDSLGNIYIADPNNNQIVEVTAAGVSSILTFSGLTPALQAPNAVAADESGNLYVADSSNNRIVKLAGVSLRLSPPAV
jgi:sugar lactone lactonase YvrE